MDAAVPPRIVARFAGVLVVGLALAFAGKAQAQVPSINVQETCQAAAGVMINLMGGSSSQNDVQICLESENRAQQQLVKDWSTYQPSDRQGCIDTRVYLPSYVEWLTCFEMNKVVREARAQGRSMTRLTNPDGSMSMPSVRKLGIPTGRWQ